MITTLLGTILIATAACHTRWAKYLNPSESIGSLQFTCNFSSIVLFGLIVAGEFLLLGANPVLVAVVNGLALLISAVLKNKTR